VVRFPGGEVSRMCAKEGNKRKKGGGEEITMSTRRPGRGKTSNNLGRKILRGREVYFVTRGRATIKRRGGILSREETGMVSYGNAASLRKRLHLQIKEERGDKICVLLLNVMREFDF